MTKVILSGCSGKMGADVTKAVSEREDVTIVAGCGIHNGGSEKSEHSGIHSFFLGKNSRVKYVEKHYGAGEGTGGTDGGSSQSV